MKSYAAAGAALWAASVVRAASGAFDVLTMNVAGLPSVLQNNDESGDKTTNSKLIGEYFAKYGYDIINVQEDFNYHAAIYAADNHTYRTATSGGAAIGSGLNTLANFDWVDFRRVKWDDCSNDSDSDCLTPKGFTFMRMLVDDGIHVDVYNLHADAGTTDADEAARTSNIKQVADYIDTWSKGNAVIVMGDTNSRYTRTRDNIAVFTSQNKMTDAFVQLERAGVVPTTETLCDNPSTTDTCETVDKVFYRGSRIMQLNATAFHYESKKFLQSNGSTLTDHNPITVQYEWATEGKFTQSAFSGGPHGDAWFNDLASLPDTTPVVSKIVFRGASRLDSVGVVLSDGTALTHGGTGGTESSLTLASGEYWTSAKFCTGQHNSETRNFYVLATTSKGNTVKAGTATSSCTTFTAPTGWQIVGTMGQNGDEVDQVAVIYAPQK